MKFLTAEDCVANMKKSKYVHREATKIERKINRKVRKSSRRDFTGLTNWTLPNGPVRKDVKREVKKRFESRGFEMIIEGNKYSLNWVVDD